ncbi:MAG: AbrB/MazE/SpoVT family DNA-binding domain-containing protein [Chloroflexi bacterium]|nr:AbrB/MazE/SpoVT family DNA-binding domain-containing protein [Chloroflexota bacterium]
MSARNLVRIQEKGQVTIPTEVRKRLGLKKGDLVAVTETPEGILITPQEVLAMKALDRIGEALKEKGLTLEELIESGREIRSHIARRKHGVRAGETEQLASLPERRVFLKLPLEKRRQALAQQAAEMASHYEEETEWRELQAGDIVDY